MYIKCDSNNVMDIFSRMLSMWISTITERFMQFGPQILKTATTV